MVVNDGVCIVGVVVDVTVGVVLVEVGIGGVVNCGGVVGVVVGIFGPGIGVVCVVASVIVALPPPPGGGTLGTGGHGQHSHIFQPKPLSSGSRSLVVNFFGLSSF